jgi:hypothetical protein
MRRVFLYHRRSDYSDFRYWHKADIHPTTVPLGFLRNLETITPSFSVQTVQVTVRDPAEIEPSGAALTREPGAGLVIFAGSIHGLQSRPNHSLGR